MPILQPATSPNQSPRTSLRLPASIRLSTPNAHRLTTITEGADASDRVPPTASRSWRDSVSHSRSNSRRHSQRRSESASSQFTQRTAPPPYSWVPEPIELAGYGDDVVLDKRLEKLRKRESDGKRSRRGGWKRAALIGAGVLLVLIGLAVGLGVGLTPRRHNEQDQHQSSGSSPSTPLQKFPLGEYSFVTALRNVETGCVSNSATWRCFPYVTYDPAESSNTASLASFNWIMSNTSSTYATNATKPIPKDGVPANLTVGTSNDPFGLTFSNKSLTYVSDSLNSSSARYTFSFTMPRMVIPSPAITADESNAECFFNNASLTANIYLAAPRSFLTGNDTASGAASSFEQWPYAVEILQTATGGTGVPECYKLIDGKRGDRITDGLTPRPAGEMCSCEYRNY